MFTEIWLRVSTNDLKFHIGNSEDPGIFRVMRCTENRDAATFGGWIDPKDGVSVTRSNRHFLPVEIGIVMLAHSPFKIGPVPIVVGRVPFSKALRRSFAAFDCG